MFKELKVIKLLILVSLLTGIIFKMNFAELAIQELYTDKQSYFPGDTVKIFCNSKSKIPLSLSVDLTSITGEYKTSFKLKISKQESLSKNIIQDGLNYEKYSDFIIPDNLNSGIYLLNKKHPLIVKSKEKSDITIVYPFMNNLIYSNINFESVFTQNSPHTSLLRSSIVDQYSYGMSNFLIQIDTSYSVNYITDIDLEKIQLYNQSKLLLIYGKSTFWSPKMAESFLEYQSNGGNLINITTFLANNICWQHSKNKITLHDSSSSISAWNTYDTLMPISIAGVEHNKSGHSENKFYKTHAINHPVFNDLNDSVLTIDATLFSAPPIYWHKNEPYLDFYKFNFHSGKILAYSDAHYKENSRLVKGIFLLKPKKTSGSIITLGTEDWCLQKNIGKKEELQTITKNAIDFLLQ